MTCLICNICAVHLIDVQRILLSTRDILPPKSLGNTKTLPDNTAGEIENILCVPSVRFHTYYHRPSVIEADNLNYILNVRAILMSEHYILISALFKEIGDVVLRKIKKKSLPLFLIIPVRKECIIKREREKLTLPKVYSIQCQC
jgi:hypothetical protein